MVVEKCHSVLVMDKPIESALENCNYRMSTLIVGDLWGPLASSLLLAASISLGAVVSSASAFTTVFALVWLGALAITMNFRMLGFRLAILSTVSYLGYSIAPLAVLSLLLLPVSRYLWPLKLLLASFGAIWSFYSNQPSSIISICSYDEITADRSSTI